MTLYHSTGIIAASGGAAAKPGMVLLTPTSIAHSGTSASIGANGQVTFTAVTSLSLNGVFSATYDNYVISLQGKWDGSGGIFVYMRLRSAGTDATGANYTYQRLYADNTTVGAERSSSQTVVQVGSFTGTAYPNGHTISVYGPFLAQPTATRNIGVTNTGAAPLDDFAGTHSLSTSYDGFTLQMFFSTTGSTGKLAVYGVKS